jgi:hypothetical protein
LKYAAVPVPSVLPLDMQPPPPTHVVTVQVAAALKGEEEGGGVTVLLGVPLDAGVTEGVAPDDSVALGVGDAEAPGQERKRTLWLEASPKNTVPLAPSTTPPTAPRPVEGDVAQPSMGVLTPFPASVVVQPKGFTRRRKKLEKSPTRRFPPPPKESA